MNPRVRPANRPREGGREGGREEGRKGGRGKAHFNERLFLMEKEGKHAWVRSYY